MTETKTNLVEDGQVIELGDPVFSIYTHPSNPGRYFAVSDCKPYFCLEGNSVVEAAEIAQRALIFAGWVREFEENDCA